MPRHKKSSKGHSWQITKTISTRDHVVQISNDSTVGDDESIWDEGDQPTTSYNIARKLSSVEEDVCYPLRTANKGDGIDYNALEEYTTEEKTSAKKDEGNYHLLPSSMMLSRIRTEGITWYV
ncbi:unnamed protein product [Rhizophagus irregularis]|uniref:Uncharacterized protein n=4 Tax=Rhizophagus irregularis TaxID=588596 RepID=A0A915ZEU6_9GLOM|nr:hypothetical protein RirG_201320 [Rhizophagus irregularis DAOM 197198w]CAB5374333.1 unnamed protein product [Rhizophagus irregularis]